MAALPKYFRRVVYNMCSYRRSKSRLTPTLLILGSTSIPSVPPKSASPISIRLFFPQPLLPSIASSQIKRPIFTFNFPLYFCIAFYMCRPNHPYQSSRLSKFMRGFYSLHVLLLASQPGSPLICAQIYLWIVPLLLCLCFCLCLCLSVSLSVSLLRLFCSSVGDRLIWATRLITYFLYRIVWNRIE